MNAQVFGYVLQRPTMKDPLLLEIPTEIVGQRVKLRAYRSSDAAAIDEAARESQPELAKVFDWASRLPTVEQRAVGLQRGGACWITRTEMAFGIWTVDGGRYLGDIGLFNPDWAVRRFEIGYWLRSSACGQGFTTEAARMLVDLAFDLLQARRVFIQCDAQNAKSAGIPIRLGFEHEGTLRNFGLRPDGTSFDLSIFGMVPSEWRRDVGSGG